MPFVTHSQKCIISVAMNRLPSGISSFYSNAQISPSKIVQYITPLARELPMPTSFCNWVHIPLSRYQHSLSTLLALLIWFFPTL